MPWGTAGPSAPGDPGAAPSVAFVINRTLVRDPDGFARRCRTAAVARGWAPLFLPTTREDHGEGLARHAAAAGAELVFAVGGDGTVRACASALAGTDVRLAIIPRGTANLAAHALEHPAPAGCGPGRRFRRPRNGAGPRGWPTAPGSPRCHRDGRHRAGRHRRRARPIGCASCGGAGWRTPRPGSGTCTVRRTTSPSGSTVHRSCTGGPGRSWSGTWACCLAVSRCCRTRGPTMACSTSGSSLPSGLADWARIGYRVLARSRRDDRCLERFRARRVEITADAELPRETDGEILTPGRSLTVTVRPGALAVRTPAADRALARRLADLELPAQAVLSPGAASWLVKETTRPGSDDAGLGNRIPLVGLGARCRHDGRLLGPGHLGDRGPRALGARGERPGGPRWLAAQAGLAGHAGRWGHARRWGSGRWGTQSAGGTRDAGTRRTAGTRRALGTRGRRRLAGCWGHARCW